MSIQRETLRLIQGDLKGTRLCGDVLVVLPTEHLLRGFVFERTLEKEMYYLWRVTKPGLNQTRSASQQSCLLDT